MIWSTEKVLLHKMMMIIIIFEWFKVKFSNWLVWSNMFIFEFNISFPLIEHDIQQCLTSISSPKWLIYNSILLIITFDWCLWINQGLIDYVLCMSRIFLVVLFWQRSTTKMVTGFWYPWYKKMMQRGWGVTVIRSNDRIVMINCILQCK